MFRNTHFALATHILAVLAIREDGPVTSAEIAASVNTNPAFLRTLLGRLKRAGLVEVTLGKGGGAVLARPARKISLLDVYHAVDPDPELPLHRCEPDSTCLVGRNIVPVLEEVMHDVEKAVGARLAKKTVADVAKEIQTRG